MQYIVLVCTQSRSQDIQYLALYGDKVHHSRENTAIQASGWTFFRKFMKLLYNWIKTDQLDVTCFIISPFTAQHVSNVSTSIFRSLWLICWVISCVVLLWLDVCWCHGVDRLGWCGILMQAEAQVLQPA